MLYATNGRAQDLPEGTQFKFWDTADWSRAYKVAKIQQVVSYGVAEAAGMTGEVYALLDMVKMDPCRVFVSRPYDQEVDWVQWARFCKYFFSFGIQNKNNGKFYLLDDIAAGNCHKWFAEFLGSRTIAVSENCFDAGAIKPASQRIDEIWFADYRKWKPELCKCDNTAEVNQIGAGLAYIVQAIRDYKERTGGGSAKNFFDSPPSMSEYAAETAPTPPPPLGDGGSISEDTTGETAVLTWVVGGVVVLGITALFLTKKS